MKNSITSIVVAALAAFAGLQVCGADFTFIAPAEARDPASYKAAAFGREMVNDAEIERVTVEATALGCFELFVNGKLVTASEDGNRGDYLRPGFTDTRKRRTYYTYDVTSLVDCAKGAKNNMSAWVGPSWFCDDIGGRPDVPPSLAVRVLVKVRGSDRIYECGTDTDWFASYDTPFARADIYWGEEYDARKSADAFASAGSARAVVVTNFTGAVTACEGAEVWLRRDLALKPAEAYVYRGATGAEGTNAFGKVKRLRDWKAGETLKLEPGETLVLDFAQNAAAIPEIVAKAAAGTELVFRGGEMLNDANGERKRGNDGPAGSLYRENLRRLLKDGALVKYVFAGTDADETYLPSFTFLGYRYAEVTVTAPTEIRSVRSIPVTSISKAMERGTLRTGVADVNRLVANCLWGQYSNYVNVPTDCPQRDERQGWTADTQVFTAAAFRNADVYRFMQKWMSDMRDAQSDEGFFPSVAPWGRWGCCGWNRLGWADAGVIVPWTCWRMTGDKAIVEQNWAAMEKFVGTQTRNRYLTHDGFQYGDWVSYEQITDKGYWDENGIRDESIKYWDYLGGCYWYWNATRMAEMAEAIGKDEKTVNGYRDLAKKARRYLKSYFFEEDGGLLKIFRHLQTAALFALKLDLYDDANAKDAAVRGLLKNFADHGDCLQTGFLGTSILMDAVTYGAGNPKMAYTLLLQHKNPSWLYSVDQGATTIWERWNSYVKETGFGPVGMNSFNHYAYGCVLDWMYGTMAGIQPGPKGGFDEFVLAPIPDERLGFVEATYRNSHGVIRSAWKYEGGTCKWSYTVPAGSKATVRVNGTECVRGPGSYTCEL